MPSPRKTHFSYVFRTLGIGKLISHNFISEIKVNPVYLSKLTKEISISKSVKQLIFQLFRSHSRTNISPIYLLSLARRSSRLLEYYSYASQAYFLRVDFSSYGLI
uniref:(northern house mosquito) hypothetical protein n=1 Tax=Culex pipiens TaxID=7175 RepID=A0A8D8EWL9_CULPI